jgi:transcriptional regulator with XRE-family HTH domain
MAHRMGDEKHRSYIARLEAGRDKIAPSLDMCLRMAGALDESIGEFLRATELADIIQIAELQPLPAVKRRLIDLIAGLEEPDADDLEELVRLWFRRKLLLPEGPEPEPLPDVTVEEEQGPPESD